MVDAQKNISDEIDSKTKKSPKTKKSADLHIIKVPNEELAKVAIKSAFENGVFNIQVIIE